MSSTPTIAHPDWDTLVDYWLGDTDGAATDAIDEHLMHCDACGTAFDEVVSLSRGVSGAFAHGAVASMLTAAFVDRLRGAGLRVREYRVPQNGSVTCSVAPDDDLLVSRLAAPLHGVTRLDAVCAVSFLPGHEERLRDVPFDAAGGEVVFAPRLAEVRQHPTHDFTVRLIAVDDAGERPVGQYTFHHQAAR